MLAFTVRCKRGPRRMNTRKRDLKIFSKAHTFYKSSDCPTCPACEAARKPGSGFLTALGAPARRALASKAMGTVAELSKDTEAEILELHGIGPSSIPKLRRALSAHGFSFRAVKKGRLALRWSEPPSARHVADETECSLIHVEAECLPGVDRSACRNRTEAGEGPFMKGVPR